jgi:hypothetical protein
MKIYVAHSSDFDYVNKLYRPLRESALNGEHDFFLPHENERSSDTKELMRECDLLLADVSKPSTGEGIEIGRAEAIGLRIVCIYESGSKVSSSLKYVCNEFIEYTNPNDMITKITRLLSKI